MTHVPTLVGMDKLMQRLYELRHNKDWRARLAILFGNSYYTPPVTCCYILKSGTEG